MKHLFVSYETAKALKELGFDEPCICSYNDKGNFNIGSTFGITNSLIDEWIRNGVTGNYICTAPTHQQVVDWFREKHRMHIKVDIQDVELNWYSYEILLEKEGAHMNELKMDMNFKSYYEALNAAIDEAIKLIKK